MSHLTRTTSNTNLKVSAAAIFLQRSSKWSHALLKGAYAFSSQIDLTTYYARILQI